MRISCKLSDSKTVTIRDLSQRDKPEELMRYINHLIAEDTCILIDKKVTLKKEREWLRSKLAAMKRGDSICLVVEDMGKIAGILHSDREPFKMRNNAVIGIALLPEYRGQGIGETAMRILIKRTKKEMKPKNIHLRVFACNKRAIALYRKLGFTRIAVLPNWVMHRGLFVDEHVMLLKD
jgi:RimJ/RimL family protein N-acetyltransferase